MDNLEIDKTIMRISVRNLVEFLLRSGDIDNRYRGSVENAMAEGSRIHRMIQKRMGSNYLAEVFLRHTVVTDRYDLVLEGRADGIITEETGITIDEIKGTYRELKRIREPVPVHLAQAKCYAWMYAARQGCKSIGVRMTYCNMETEEIKYFHENYDLEELSEWFEGLLGQYHKWAELEYEWKQISRDSMKRLPFPFVYREGQKELMAYVYQTIYHKKKLFLEAPTGVGKTISTVFPAIKAMGEGKGDKLFYLTAKTITRTVAVDTFSILRGSGLRMKTVTLTAKEKICPLDEAECNPVACPCAKGHYDRINNAVYELLTAEEDYCRDTIEQYARSHQVCPFEMSLDLTLFSDAVICDYNYLFDPHVYLKRFFSEGVNAEYLFLIDEAHNLLERGREMYSAVLIKEEFLRMKKLVREYDSRLEKHLEKCNKEMLLLKRRCEKYHILYDISTLINLCSRLFASLDTYLQEHDDSPIRKEVLEFYFEISHFLEMYDRVDDNYVIYCEMKDDSNFQVKLLCVNPSLNLMECMAKGRSSILFSATLLPIQYYKKLLGGEESDYEVYARSTFDERKRALFIGGDVTSRYARRTESEYHNIASYLHEILRNRHGNYMAFFPSHAFLQKVYLSFRENFFQEGSVECILQTDSMNEEQREAFLKAFSYQPDTRPEDSSLLGFCVLGGIFSEGIDLKADSLIGAIVVGTGIPQICTEREIFKNFFDEQGESGFDYAYRFPGMNKVLQAAGRVIRTADDVGIVALLDERFARPDYQRLFPYEWQDIQMVSRSEIAGKVERFWDEWL